MSVVSKPRDHLIVSLFKLTLINYELSFTCEILTKFKPTLLRYSRDLIPFMIEQLEKHPFCLGVKLEIFYQFQEMIIFKHAFQFVDVIKKLAWNAINVDGIFPNNINPLMDTLIILRILKRLKKGFPVLQLTIDQVSERLIVSILQMIEDYDPYLMGKMLRY